MTPSNQTSSARPMDAIGSVSPALGKYTDQSVMGDLWKRPGLSPRDRSIITVSALIARGQTAVMPYYVSAALDHGVKPNEISEIVTHLAFYAGWPNAFAVLPVMRDLFDQRGITLEQLPDASPTLLPLDAVAEERRAAMVQENLGFVSQALVDYTSDLLFHDLWLRPDLKPRDRSLATVSALIALGYVAQITFHLNKAMDNGLTKEQVSEIVAHMAFYGDWPPIMSAVPVIKDILKSRVS